MRPILRTMALPAAVLVTLALASCGASSAPSAADQQASASSGATSPPVVGPPVPAGATPSATGTPSPVGPPGKGPANAVDLEFANTMTFYHRYEEVLADLVPTRAKDAKIKPLAATIKATQGAEITRMSGWLAGAGMTPPSVKDGQVLGHQMTGMGGATKAMLSTPEMTALRKATGSGFDRMWLQLMIRHHEGAGVIAKAELAKGINAEAKPLAQTVIDRQSAQLVTMKSILAGISG